MKVTGVEWDRANRRHFREHGRCTEEQVEDVLLQRRYRSRVAPVSPGRYRFEGRTALGRYMVVIAARVGSAEFRPITCWPLTGRRLESYRAWRRTIRR